MAKVTGPLFSMSASGTIGKAVTYGTWKGRPWARVWFTPENPQSAKQVNVRKALRLALEYYQSDVSQEAKDAYEAGAAQFGYSGYNLYMKRAINAYISQLGSDTDPLSVTTSGLYPDDTFTWSPVV